MLHNYVVPRAIGLMLFACLACKERQAPAGVAARIETPQEYWNAPATISRLEWLRINMEAETATEHGNCPDHVAGGDLPACVSYYYTYDDEHGSADLFLMVYHDAPASYVETYKRYASDAIRRKSKDLFNREVQLRVHVDIVSTKAKRTP